MDFPKKGELYRKDLGFYFKIKIFQMVFVFVKNTWVYNIYKQKPIITCENTDLNLIEISFMNSNNGILLWFISISFITVHNLHILLPF